MCKGTGEKGSRRPSDRGRGRQEEKQTVVGFRLDNYSVIQQLQSTCLEPSTVLGSRGAKPNKMVSSLVGVAIVNASQVFQHHRKALEEQVGLKYGIKKW